MKLQAVSSSSVVAGDTLSNTSVVPVGQDWMIALRSK